MGEFPIDRLIDFFKIMMINENYRLIGNKI
jgi:hypothetical protein